MGVIVWGDEPSPVVGTRRLQHEVLRAIGVLAVVGLCYVAGAELAWRIFGAADIGLVFFPPAGVTLAALVLLPRRQWWAVVVAIVVAELSVDLEHGLSLGVAAGYALANTVEPFVGAMLLLRLTGGRVEFGRRVGMLRFLVAAVGAGGAAGAVIGGWVKSVDSAVPWWNAALHWWAGDGLGILAIAVPILVWRELALLRGRRLVEGIVLLITLVVASVMSYWALEVPPAFMVLPLMVWVAVRFETPGVAVGSAVMAVIANVATASGRGPFASIDVSPQSQLAVAQLSLGAVILTVWLLATESRERKEIATQQANERASQAEAATAAAMGELSEVLSRQTTVDEIVDVVASHIRARFDGANVAIGTHDPDADRVQPVSPRLPDSDQLGVMAAMPLTVGGVGHGALIVTRKSAVPFDVAERDILEAIAGSVSRALERIRLFEAERVARLEAQLAHGEVAKLLKRAEFEAERLRESENGFKLLADQSPLIVWVQDTAGRQEWANQRYCEFFGVSRDQLNLDRWQSRTHPQDMEAHVATLQGAVADRKPFHSQSRTRRADGEWRWMETWARPRFDPAGVYMGHVGTAVDITDRREAETELQERASLDAFQVRLADALRDLDDEQSIKWEVIQLLAQHLECASARFVSIGDNRDGSVDEAVPASMSSIDAMEFQLADVGTKILLAVRPDETIVVHDVAADERLGDVERRAAAKSSVVSIVVQPMAGDADTTHVLVVARSEPHRWSMYEVAAIKQAAERTAQAVRRGSDERLEQAQRARAELVGNLLDSLQSQPGLTEAAQLLVETLVPAVADYATVEQFIPGFELIGITHRDPNLLPVLRALREHHRLEPSDTHAAAHAARHRQPQLLSVITPAMRAEFATDNQTAALLNELGPRSNIMVPLDFGGGTRGTLLVGHSDPTRKPYNEDDLAFVTDLARRVEVSLAAKRVRNAEHQIAVTLQNALLPDTIRWDPSVTIEARYAAAGDQLQVGGDWYDTFAWPDGRIGMMVGDVVGHSIESAAAMGRLRAAASALAATIESSPAKLLEALDRFAQSPDGVDFATVACVVIDPATGLLTYASAGHPPTLVVTAGNSVHHLSNAQSPPLCASVQSSRPEATMTLEAGSLVVLYSDGLIERRRESLATGMLRLETAIIDRFEQSTADILDGLISDLTNESPAQDDIVVVACRYMPALAVLHLETPAHASELAGIRRQLRQWLRSRDADTATEQTVLLVVGEAITNVVDHAYRRRPPSTRTALNVNSDLIVLDLADHGHQIVAHITDFGSWRQPGSHSLDRGRGTTIIDHLTSRHTRQSTVLGTTVTVAVPTATLQVETP